jgi:hypothetical protein
MKVNDQVFISKRSSGPDYTFLTQYILFTQKQYSISISASVDDDVLGDRDWMYVE